MTVAAAALRSHLPGAVLSESTPLSGLVDDSVPTPTMLAARAAYDEAGLGPEDLHVVECQDTDDRELLSYEELGLCVPGGSAALVDEGATAMGGRLPVNPSGGLLSKGGAARQASALGQVVELVRQLRGQAATVICRQPHGARPHRRAGGERQRGHPSHLTRPRPRRPAPSPA